MQIAILSLLFSSLLQAAQVGLRITDRSEDLKTLKLGLDGNQTRFLKIGDNIPVSFSASEKKCTGVVSRVDESYITLKVDDIFTCWKEDRYLRRGTIALLDSEKIIARDIESDLTAEEVRARKQNLLGQLNDTNLYLYNFELRKKKLEADYDNRIKLLRLEKIKALESLYKERRIKSDLQIQLKVQVEKLKKANQYYIK